MTHQLQFTRARTEKGDKPVFYAYGPGRRDFYLAVEIAPRRWFGIVVKEDGKVEVLDYTTVDMHADDMKAMMQSQSDLLDLE